MTIIAYFKNQGLFADQRTIDAEKVDFKGSANYFTVRQEQKMFISRDNQIAFGVSGFLAKQTDDVLYRPIVEHLIEYGQGNPERDLQLQDLLNKLRVIYKDANILVMTKEDAFVISIPESVDEKCEVLDLKDRGYFGIGTGIRHANILFDEKDTYPIKEIQHGLQYMIENNPTCGGAVNVIYRKKLKPFTMTPRVKKIESGEEI